MNRRTVCTAQGFTITEFLVVLAVIAVLVALLQPALTRAKARSRSMACMSNLHQIGIALHAYLGDEHAYPEAGAGGWFGALRLPAKARACPSVIGFSYWINRWGSGPGYTEPHLGLGPTGHGARRELEVMNPARMVAVSDPSRELVPPAGRQEMPGTRKDLTKLNLLMCDGHVESVSDAQVTRSDSTYRQLWNIDHLPHDEFWDR